MEVISEHRPEEESKRLSYSNIWGQGRQRPSYSDILGLFDGKEETSKLEWGIVMDKQSKQEPERGALLGLADHRKGARVYPNGFEQKRNTV